MVQKHPLTKAIIPAAGRGTRMKPATDILPKELLPIGAKPSLYFVLEEAYLSGVEEILLILSEFKKPFMQHLEKVFPKLSFRFLIQEQPLGLGHAILLGEKYIGDSPFLVLLPDDIIDHSKPACQQLIEVFQEVGQPVNTTRRMPPDQLHRYGVYEISQTTGPLHKAKGVVEKPSSKEAPSDLIVVGRYLFTPELFFIQKKTAPGRGGEIQLTDAMHTLAKQGKLYSYEFEGKYLDIGNPLGMIQASIYFGLKEYGTAIYQGITETPK